MNSADVFAAIEGYEDVLTPAGQELDEFYRRFSCPRCMGDLQKEFDVRHTFSDPDCVVPRALLRCPNCRYLIDPHSNVVLETGNPAKIPFDPIPIINPE